MVSRNSRPGLMSVWALSRPAQRPWGRRILHHKFDFLHLSGVFLSDSAPPPANLPIRRPAGSPTRQARKPGSIPSNPVSFLPAGRSSIQPAHPADVSSPPRPARLPCGRSAVSAAGTGCTAARAPAVRRGPRLLGRASRPPVHALPSRAAVLSLIGFSSPGETRRNASWTRRAASRSAPYPNIPASSGPPRAPARPPRAERATGCRPARRRRSPSEGSTAAIVLPFHRDVPHAFVVVFSRKRTGATRSNRLSPCFPPVKIPKMLSN